MRILVATSYLQVLGGAERYLHGVIRALRAAGHEIALLVEHDAPAGSERVDEGSALAIVDRDGAARSARAAEGFRPDVRWIHGLEAPGLEARLVDRGPAILFAHGYYGTCGTGTKRFARPRWEPCTRRLSSACLLVTYTRRCAGRAPFQVWSTYRRQRERNILLTRYRRVIVASGHMAAEFRHHVAADTIATIPLPVVDVEPLPSPPHADQSSGPIVFHGRMTPEKGLLHLLDGVALAERALGRRLRLIVVGDGPQRQAAASRAVSLGLEVEFTGWLTGTSRTRHLEGAALAALPSLWPEPFGMAGIEAGARGVPCVAYAVGGITDWLQPGVSGEIAPAPPDPSGLSAAIVRAVQDPLHHAALCRGAWDVAARHTMAAHLDALIPLFESVL